MTASLKVCIVSRAPFVGGAEVAAERLAVGLARDGHDAFVVVGYDNAVLARLRAAGVRSTSSPLPTSDRSKFWRYLAAVWRLRRLFTHERPDIIHSNDLPTHQIASDAARGLGIPVVCHHRFIYGGPAIDWLNRRGAARHLFVSDALMHDLCEASQVLAAQPRAVVYDGLELGAVPTSSDQLAARAALGLDASQVVVLFAGQFIERKGIAPLLQAWAGVPSAVARNAVLVLAGDDPAGQGGYRVAMEQLARDLGVDARTRFVGFQRDLAPWLAASDVAVVPSLLEPLGNATLEAMAAALPVIGSDVGGIPEMVRHAETGLLCPPNEPMALSEALARLIAAPQLRRQFGEAGRAKAEQQFSLAAHIRSVLAEYDVVRHATVPSGRPPR